MQGNVLIWFKKVVVGKIGRLKQNHKTPVENRGFYAAC